MPLDTARVRDYLNAFDLNALFVEELGWENFSQRLPIQVGDEAFDLTGVAEKRGVQIFECQTDTLPDYATRKRIEQKVKDYAFEHLIIFTDTAQTTQIWQWVSRRTRSDSGQRTAYREHTYTKGSTGDALIQKLGGIEFQLSEEEAITIDVVTRRLKDALDKDKVTKKFYDTFKRERDAFLSFVEGIQAQGDREWYASVMLNRLMFVYFIQRKGFLDGDTHYLQNRLHTLKEKGDDQFHSFYRYFLIRLFHEGLGGRERSGDLERLLGRIPYLNGGLFDVHELEETYPDIQIPDEAFERIFAFFDQYDWYLDERALGKENEINPDVLGYIFEKYINRKQMGAYYTKEDITDYISKNTIIPALLDRAQKSCKIAFEGESSVWTLLQADPDRYIYDAVKKGAQHELPADIAAGISDVSQRDTWNTPAPDDYALPTEIWREVVTRRQRYEEVRGKLENGEVKSVGDLITYNLNVTQFMQDVIENAEGPDLIRAIWLAVAGRTPEVGTNQTYQAGISVLDPTCGSGAFLFAALNILQPIYEACLDRMESFVSDASRSGEHTDKYKDFQRTLNRVAKHPNRDYFILKSIILDNLYGVDIMPEAVEIAKLRLFLKLAAQVAPAPERPNYGIEPLPDIDFNIRAGNTLVGYASYYEIKEAIEGKEGNNQLIRLDMFDAMTPIAEKAEEVDRLFKLFRQQQIMAEEDGAPLNADTAETKAKLRERLRGLENELNVHLARDYGVNVEKKAEYKRWLESHQPFHWYTEFYGLMSSGGFDVVVGNPPWKEYSSVKKSYQVLDYQTVKGGNLYGLCTERSLQILSQKGYLSFIVQLPLVSSSRMENVRSLLRAKSERFVGIPFDDRPGKLFTGLENCRSAVFFCKAGQSRANGKEWMTRYQRWASEARGTLLENLVFSEVNECHVYPELFPKQANQFAANVLCKLAKAGEEHLGEPELDWRIRKLYFLSRSDSILDKSNNRVALLRELNGVVE